MKNLYFLDGEEKDRILNLHESATKRQYLSEQGFNYNDPLGMNAPIKDTAVQGPAGDHINIRNGVINFGTQKKVKVIHQIGLR